MTITFNNLTVSETTNDDGKIITINTPLAGTSATYVSDETYQVSEDGVLVKKHYIVNLSFA